MKGPLRDGVEYVDGWGNSHCVMGPTKVNPEWVWTLGGFWFRRSDGRKINYSASRGSYPQDTASNWDLKGESK